MFLLNYPKPYGVASIDQPRKVNSFALFRAFRYRVHRQDVSCPAAMASRAGLFFAPAGHGFER